MSETPMELVIMERIDELENEISDLKSELKALFKSIDQLEVSVQDLEKRLDRASLSI